MTRLVRAAVDGETRIGVLDGDSSVALLDRERHPTIASVLQAPPVLEQLAEEAETMPRESVQLLPPIDPDARVFCVAQNYFAHAQEVSGTEAPPAPVIFMKPTSALVGPNDEIRLAPVTAFLDYEAELAVVLGNGDATGSDDASVTVAAATCLNDGSARDLQPAELGGKPIIDWFSGKSLDRSGAIGPWLHSVSGADELADRRIICRLNGEVVQDDRTSSMVHSISTLLSFINSRVTLRVGDVVATGTPGGVGMARGVSLQDGDTVEIEVEGVGLLANTVRAKTG